MVIRASVVCFVVLFSVAFAQQCPQNSRGKYPSCECLNGVVYDPTYNWCGSELNELAGECPPDGPGIFPNCNCADGKSFDSQRKVCITLNQSVCPKGATGTPPNCKCEDTFVFDEIHWYCRPWYLRTTTALKPYSPVPTCNGYQYGIYPDCHWRPCPENSLNPDDHEPNCQYNYTVHFKPCDSGLVGTGDEDCHTPCPAYHYGKYPDCHRIRCQTGPGWSGEYAPDCKYNPKCPPEYPGVWPYCDLYKAKDNTLPPRPVTTPRATAPTRTVPTSRTQLPTQTAPTRPVRTSTVELPHTTSTPRTQQPARTVPTARTIPTARTVPTYIPPTESRKSTPVTQVPTSRATTRSPITYIPPEPVKTTTTRRMTTPKSTTRSTSPGARTTTPSPNTYLPPATKQTTQKPVVTTTPGLRTTRRTTTISIEPTPAESCNQRCMAVCQDQCSRYF